MFQYILRSKKAILMEGYCGYQQSCFVFHMTIIIQAAALHIKA